MALTALLALSVSQVAPGLILSFGPMTGLDANPRNDVSDEQTAGLRHHRGRSPAAEALPQCLQCGHTESLAFATSCTVPKNLRRTIYGHAVRAGAVSSQSGRNTPVRVTDPCQRRTRCHSVGFLSHAGASGTAELGPRHAAGRQAWPMNGGRGPRRKRPVLVMGGTCVEGLERFSRS